MAVRFETVTLVFNPGTGGSERQSNAVTVHFARRLRRADVALQGFRLRFDNGDHHVLEQEVSVRVERFENDAVTVRAEVGLRDSGGFDDPYSGFVQALVIVETEDP